MKASEAGPIPTSALTAVLSLRDVDGRDVCPGIYRAASGAYLAVKCRDGVPVGPVTKGLTTQEAFRIYRKLLARIRAGMDVWRDGEARFLQEVAAIVPEDPKEAVERPFVCIRGTDGKLEGRGVFTDRRGRFFTGVQEDTDGEIRGIQRVTTGEALAEAAKIQDGCPAADLDYYTDLIWSASIVISLQRQGCRRHRRDRCGRN